MVGGHLPEDFNVYSQLPLSAPYRSARGSIAGELVSPLTRGETHIALRALCAFASNNFNQLLSLLKGMNSHSNIGLLGVPHSQMSQPQQFCRHQEMRLTLIGEGMQTRR